MTTAESQARIDELKSRWAEDPSSRVFVQLAEEYRRNGDLPEAIAVLEQGLSKQPNYVTAQVTLGRCHLASGNAQEAVEILSRVMEQDPSHPLAGKLLVEAHLETGELAEAKRRLDLYRMMADGDPEIDQLEDRLQQAQKSRAQGTWIEDSGKEDTGIELGGAESFGADDAGIEGAGAVATAADAEQGSADVFDLGAVELSFSDEEAVEPAAGQEPPGTGAEPEPFDLSAPRSGPPRLAPLDASDEPFRLEPAPQPARAATASATRPPKDEPFGDLLGAETVSNRSRPEGDIFGLGTPETPAAETRAAESLAAEIPAAVEPVAPSPAALHSSPAIEAGGSATADRTARAEDLEPEESEAEPESDSGPEKEGEEATVTLGRLYMSQGHEDEAARIFRSVLERDPGNEISRNALAELETRKAATAGAVSVNAAPVEAAPVEGTRGEATSETEKTPSAQGITARKISKLEDYLERLRRAAG